MKKSRGNLKMYTIKQNRGFYLKKMLSMLFSYVFLTLINGFSTRNFHYTCFYVLILKAAPFITCNISVNKTTGKLILVLVFFFYIFQFCHLFNTIYLQLLLNCVSSQILHMKYNRKSLPNLQKENTSGYWALLCLYEN